ncbi:hypothetical protein, partial [uncultured Faecalibaculum sp.]|uniref:hypothetical protein n=1 Tax=uncultured Faecalibaculum sp. TaxID=1729681 RepID=UPI00261347E8
MTGWLLTWDDYQALGFRYSSQLKEAPVWCRRSLKTGQEIRIRYKTIQRRFFEPEKQSLKK